MVQLYYSNAEFNAHPSQAKVANGIFNAVQSDRLAFIRKVGFKTPSFQNGFIFTRTTFSTKYVKFVQTLLKNANN